MNSFAVICLIALTLSAFVSSDPIPLNEENQAEPLTFFTEEDLDEARDNILTEGIKKLCEKIEAAESNFVTDFLKSKCKEFLESTREDGEFSNEGELDEARESLIKKGIKMICDKFETFESDPVIDFLKSKCKELLESSRSEELAWESANELDFDEARDNILTEGIKKLCEKIEAAESNFVTDFLKSKCKEFLESAREDIELSNEGELDEARESLMKKGIKMICDKFETFESDPVIDFLKSKCKELLESSRSEELAWESANELDFDEARDNILTEGIKKLCEKIEAAESNFVTDFLKSKCKEFLESAREDIELSNEGELDEARESLIKKGIKMICDKFETFESDPVIDFLKSKCKELLESSRSEELAWESANELDFDEARDNILTEGIKKLCEKIEAAESNFVTDFLKSKCKEFLESAREDEELSNEGELDEARESLMKKGIKMICDKFETFESDPVIDFLKSKCKELLESSRSEELAWESANELDFDEARDNILTEGIKKLCEKIEAAESNFVTDFLKSKCKEFLESAREDEEFSNEEELDEARESLMKKGIKMICDKFETFESDPVIDFLKSKCKELLESSRKDEALILNMTVEEDFNEARENVFMDWVKKLCEKIESSESSSITDFLKSKCKSLLETAREEARRTDKSKRRKGYRNKQTSG